MACHLQIHGIVEPSEGTTPRTGAPEPENRVLGTCNSQDRIVACADCPKGLARFFAIQTVWRTTHHEASCPRARVVSNHGGPVDDPNSLHHSPKRARGRIRVRAA